MNMFILYTYYVYMKGQPAEPSQANQPASQQASGQPASQPASGQPSSHQGTPASQPASPRVGVTGDNFEEILIGFS